MSPQIVHDHGFRLRLNIAVFIDAVQKVLGADIGSQDNDRVLKVHRLSHGIRDPTVVQNLQKDIEHIRMGLLHLVEQDDAVRFSPHRFRQLSALIIAHISWRRSDQSGYGMLLHVLAHVDPDHVVLIVKQAFRQRLGKLRLSDAGGAEEQERTDGLGRILNAGLGADNGLRHLFHALVLADDPLMELLVQMERFIPLAFRQLRHRDPGPAGNDPGDLILGHAFVNQAQILILYLFFLFPQFLFHLRKFSVLQLRRFIQVIFLLGVLDFPMQRLYLFPKL